MRERPFTAVVAAAVAALSLASAPFAAGQALPVEFRQQQTQINHLSVAGKPLSNVVGDPVGSDGRLETPVQQGDRGLSSAEPTAGQFRGFIALGAVVRTRPSEAATATGYASYTAYAQDVLPNGGPPGGRIFMARAQVGAPYISRRLELLFGSMIALPAVDISDNPLGDVRPEDYWQREPWWDTIVDGVHVDAPYYWSRHARAVFANRPGPVEVAWRRTAAIPDADPAAFQNDPDHVVIGGRVYPLLRQSYLVSGSPAKPPRRMYWTEGSFSGSGITVPVPEGVTANFIFTDLFPKTVQDAYEDPGSSQPVPPGGGETFTERRTIFYNQDTGAIHAFNWQGRIFLELLGDVQEGDRRQFLGTEIIDVVRRVNPADISVHLGEQLTAWPDGNPDDSHLLPQTLLRSTDAQFAYQHFKEGERVQFYALRETRNLNDFLLHWTEEGVQGLRWPLRFTRYQMVWPDDISMYSHYMRPPAATDAEAQLTAVEMPLSNVPIIEYQDPLDRPRAALNQRFAFYTHLDAQQPAHRTLLRFMSGDDVAFERVFSWLADDLSVDGSGTLRAHNRLAEILGTVPDPGDEDPVPPLLSAWQPETGTFVLENPYAAPRVVDRIAIIGERITAPFDEAPPLPGEPYWAGHIRTEHGTGFNPFAYADPFAAGFEEANLGAIIPVNAIPGNDRLEVWWFRSNNPNLEQGFARIYWPTVVGRYTLQWPSMPREIVLASNDGSGALVDLEAAASIYVQNNPLLPGYNPNEEHAMMRAGQAYALRDDLNITTPGPDYSSEPYVLLEYTDGDGRPSMSVFKVLREKPETGEVFDYIFEAGTILQPPMPLGLMDPPVEGSGDTAINYNTEPRAPGGAGDLPGNWDDATHGSGRFAHYPGFTFRDRNEDFWVYRGLNAGPPPLAAGSYDPVAGVFNPPPPAVAVAGVPFTYTMHASQRPAALRLAFKDSSTAPVWLRTSGLQVIGTPPLEAVGETFLLELVLTSTLGDAPVDLTLQLDVVETGAVTTQGMLQLQSTAPQTGTVVLFNDRPPYLAADPTPANSFTMRFYYKTQEGFAWPGIAQPPEVGAIVPYLRPFDGSAYVGDPADKATESLEIVYRPVWPVDTPGMRLGDTLMDPKEGLPDVSSQTSLQILYQQSTAADIAKANVAVVLHDPTREKEVSIAAPGIALEELPVGVRTETYQGRVFFPNLPPHLVERVFFDPFRGTNGHLVYKGEVRSEGLGASYLVLNVLRGADLQTVIDLCPSGDADFAAWENAVRGLAAKVETFKENPEIPGTYIPDTTLDRTVAIEDMVEIHDHNTAVDSYALSASGPGTGFVTLMAGGGAAFTPAAEPVSLHIIRIEPVQFPGTLKVILPTNPLSEQLTLQHSADLAGRFNEYEYEWRIAAPVNGFPPLVGPDTMDQWERVSFGPELPRYTLGGANIRTLSDNYLIVRYRPLNPDHPLYVANPAALDNPDDAWSAWTEPNLAPGWIKRVLAGINPFNQRVTDLFNNTVNTDVSLLTQAGTRWEGDIALNLENINNFGLIEIYETVLNRGRMLSIDAGINYGPANDALLLAAGYLNDLYMLVGNEAWADAANPTIGIGTANETYGDIATSLFAFRGQVPTLLEEELALLRGRDDIFLPGTRVAPVYNRLIWNYTRGIDAGEVIYALNYNIKENPDGTPTGTIEALDAAHMYPQGHGDAYGHYLTALKGYFSLLMNNDFDWVPRVEAILLLGQPVSVDYLDERKFAAAAAAVARAGQQVFDLTWRKDFQSADTVGWEHFGATRDNPRTGTTRHWGMDHWATRTGQGAYLHWLVGNALLPAEDPNPNNEGIQRIDRTTVPELTELPVLMDALQTSLNNAEGGLTPLGLPDGSIAFDIDPSAVADGLTHFEQIYDRALVALNNAVSAFDDAKDVTRLMRSEEDELFKLRNDVSSQELAYRNALIELYGTPYPDDIGPGRTYTTGYNGPDLLHFMYVDLPELPNGIGQLQTTNRRTYRLDLQTLPSDWRSKLYKDLDFYQTHGNDYTQGVHFIDYELGPHGFFDKPPTWTGKRRSPGKLQQAISELIASHQSLAGALVSAQSAQLSLEKKVAVFNARVAKDDEVTNIERGLRAANDIVKSVNLVSDIVHEVLDATKQAADDAAKAAQEGIPKNFIAGLAAGGDVASAARLAIALAGTVTKGTINAKKIASKAVVKSLTLAEDIASGWARFERIDTVLEYDQQLREWVAEFASDVGALAGHLRTINAHLRALDDAERNYRALVAEGDRILEEREIFRIGAAAVVQGFRTRDAAFRIFRNEKLERYKTLFDLAARYAFLAAQAYDYETGLLGSAQGQVFINRIVAARALGVVQGGEPQFAGSNTGDPGLSSVLAEMMADWSVLRGRLGFNNPDVYGTTVSLRGQRHRILPGSAGAENWRDVLQSYWVEDILADPDVRRHALRGEQPIFAEPGLVIPFGSTIASGRNFFGNPLLAGDTTFSPASFATKIFSVGIALPGYIGLVDPATNLSDIDHSGAQSPDDPVAPWLNPDGLAATPYIYLIPTGVDSMRSPPLGDTGQVRTWDVRDVTVPLPFNVGASQFSTFDGWQSADFLTEELFSVRKHQPFRPVSAASVFSLNNFGSSGQMQSSPFTNSRLIGRSVWNSEWKIVIPGSTLYDDPDEGLRRLIRTLEDIQLHFITYSYSGN